MNRLSASQILRFEQWEKVRSVLRPVLIHEKDRRRLAVGSHLTFLFENAATLWYQVEEMVRSERMSDSAPIQQEVDTYNELIPGPGELSATLLIEYAEDKERDLALKRLVGLERHIWLQVGERRLAVKFDERQMEKGAISSVQFVRIPLEGVSVPEFTKSAMEGHVSIEVDHPSLAARASVSGLLAASLIEDLSS